MEALHYPFTTCNLSSTQSKNFSAAIPSDGGGTARGPRPRLDPRGQRWWRGAPRDGGGCTGDGGGGRCGVGRRKHHDLSYRQGPEIRSTSVR